MKKITLFRSLLAIFLVSLWGGVKAETYSYTFTKKIFNAVGDYDLSGISWNVDASTSYWGYESARGQQIGCGNNPAKSLVIKTSGINGTITNVIVATAGAKNTNATLAVSVGETTFLPESSSLVDASKSYTFEGSATGEIKLQYSQTSSVALYIKSITVEYTTSGGGEDPEPTSVAAPTFSVAGGEYFNTQSVTLTTTTEGASIYYTTDGNTEPTAEATLYVAENPIAVATTTTIKAIAIKDEVSSEVATATYTISVAAPVFTPTAGIYPVGETLNVTLESATTAATIYYTTDGTDPTNQSTAYNAETPITFTEVGTYTVKAIAINGENQSAIVTAEYKITGPVNFTKITDISKLVDGRYIITNNVTTNNEGTYAIGANRAGNAKRLQAYEVAATENVITTADQNIIWDITVEENGSISLKNGEKYATKTGKNQLEPEETPTVWSYFKPSFEEATGDLILACKASKPDSIIMMNKSTSPISFACYLPTMNSGVKLAIYKATTEEPEPGTPVVTIAAAEDETIEITEEGVINLGEREWSDKKDIIEVVNAKVTTTAAINEELVFTLTDNSTEEGGEEGGTDEGIEPMATLAEAITANNVVFAEGELTSTLDINVHFTSTLRDINTAAFTLVGATTETVYFNGVINWTISGEAKVAVINPVLQGVELTSVDGILTITTDHSAPMAIYNAAGALIATRTIDSTYSARLTPGIYVVVVDGTATKAIVR